MVDLRKLQKEVYQNKLNKGFNVTDVNKEFCLIYGEVAEAYEAWRKKERRFRRGIGGCCDILIRIIGDIRNRFRE